MHRHLRGLLVAAAATLASASQPFSWADAQASMHACTNESRPLVDKYAYLSTRHALGRRLVEPRRDADRAAATCTEAPARARAAGAFETSPPCWTAETSRPRTREGAGASGIGPGGGAAPPQ